MTPKNNDHQTDKNDALGSPLIADTLGENALPRGGFEDGLEQGLAVATDENAASEAAAEGTINIVRSDDAQTDALADALVDLATRTNLQN